MLTFTTSGTSSTSPARSEVADDHGGAAVQSVDQGARQRSQQQARRGGGAQGQAQVQGRADLQHQHAQRHLVDPIAEERDELPGPEQREVPVAEERQVRRLRALAPDRRRADRGRLRWRPPGTARGTAPWWRRPQPWRRQGGRRERVAAPRDQGARRAERRLRAGHGVDDRPEDAHGQQDVADADHVPDDAGSGAAPRRRRWRRGARTRPRCRTRSGSGTGRRPAHRA